MIMWVAPIGDIAAARPLTAEKVRPIRQYFWAPDSRQLLFINDAGGDENFLLYGVNTTTAKMRSLTPFKKTRVQIINVSPSVKDRILVGVNNRDLRTFEVDVRRSWDLAARAPAGTLLVAESGLTTRDDLDSLADHGVHCFLIGEALMREHDIAAATRALVG